jgi:hypothetical protein
MAVSESASKLPPSQSAARFEISALVVGALVALGGLQLTLHGEQTNFAELALGEETTSVYASIGDHKIHCDGLADAEHCTADARARNAKRVALWLGNSQLHAINQLQPGDETATPLLHRALRPRGVDVVAISMPNATPMEHYLLFSHLLSRLPVRYLVLSVVFDDLRETDVRSGMTAALQDPATAEVLMRSESGRQILARYSGTATGDLAALDQTVQEHSETAMNAWLDQHSTLWSLRREARGWLFSNLRGLRNAALGITPQTKRKLIPARYRENMAALRAALDAAEVAGVDVLLYVAPIRNDVEIPYVEAEYARFKGDLESLAAEYAITYANLEDLVPAPLWGMKSRARGSDELELDFMHFQAPGHTMLAEAIRGLLEAQLNGDRP